MVLVQWAADFVYPRQLGLDRVGQTVLGHHVVERSGDAAFGARDVAASEQER